MARITDPIPTRTTVVQTTAQALTRTTMARITDPIPTRTTMALTTVPALTPITAARTMAQVLIRTTATPTMALATTRITVLEIITELTKAMVRMAQVMEHGMVVLATAQVTVLTAAMAIPATAGLA